MRLKWVRCSGLCLSLLLFGQLTGAQAAAHARQQRGGAPHAASAERGEIGVKTKERYFLGEVPAVTISVRNAGHAPQTVKEAEHRKFTFEVTGPFQSDARQEKKTLVYDGSWDIPKGPARVPQPNQSQEWGAPRKREPRYVNLSPGESTDLTLDLSDTFRSYLGVGKYHMIVTSEDGQRVVKDFEVDFDDGQSFPVLAKMLVSDETTERNWAIYNLVTFSRSRLVTLLEGLVKSGDEKQRDLAKEVLTKLAAGHYDPVKLRVEIKERYFVGEPPVIAVSIYNGSSTVLTVKEAASQKFSVELTKVADPKPETKTCVYDGGQSAAKPSAGRDRRKPAPVKLGESDSTTLSLNLFECLRTRLDAGSYELAVTAADEPAVGGQKVVKRFEVYFEEGRSVPTLAQLLKSDEAAEQQWAVSALARHDRPKLVTLLEELVKTGSAKHRDFATRTLQDIKAGRFGPNISSFTR
jgi:hypothetical protein